MGYKVPFGMLQIDRASRSQLSEVAASNWVSEGPYVAEFEEKFAAKFGWKYCIATSSGTDAGIVVWSAIRELEGYHYGDRYCGEPAAKVLTPACAFVATVNCLLAAGLTPDFSDIALSTLNLDPMLVFSPYGQMGIQFVATMGKPSPIREIAAVARAANLRLVGDFCEAHGAMLWDGIAGAYADGFCDAAIYSFYAAHLVVGGEGGCIVTNDDELAGLCRSIKSHGRPPDGYFNFDRVGFNAKWNEFCAAVALGSLERFDETFERRREVRAKLLRALEPFEDQLILYRDGPGEVIAPHAFPLVLRDERGSIELLYRALDAAGVQCKTLFGSLPTQHKAFAFLGYEEGAFPVAERVARTGLHFGCHELMTGEDVALIAKTVGNFLAEKR